MATHQGKSCSSSSPLLPFSNSNSCGVTQIKSVLPFFGFLCMTISCGTSIYKARLNGDTPTVVFTTFLYFATYLLNYWSNLHEKLPPSMKYAKMHPLNIGIYVLGSSIMLAYAFAFSRYMSLANSVFVIGFAICGITLLFYLYFLMPNGDNNRVDGSSNQGKRRKARECCRNGRATLKKYRHIALALEIV